MTTRDDMRRLINDSLDKKVFSIEELIKEYNLTIYFIKKAVKSKEFSRESTGFYKIEKRFKREFWLEELIDRISKKDYEEALNILDRLFDLGDGCIEDYNCYLYLLGMLTSLPDAYRDRLEKMTLEDICNPKVSIYNSITSDIFLLNIYNAYNIYCKYLKKRGGYSLHDQVMRILLGNSSKAQARFEKEVYKCLIDGDYFGVKTTIEKRKRKHKIKPMMEILLDLVKLREAIERFRAVPILSQLQSIETSVAKAKNPLFENANNRSDNRLLLDLIKGILKEMQDVKDEANEKGEILLECPVALMVMFDDLTGSIMDNRVQDGFSLLEKYLSEKGKEKYCEVLRSMLLLSIKEGDYSFYIPLKAMSILESSEPSIEELVREVAERPDETKHYVISPVPKKR